MDEILKIFAKPIPHLAVFFLMSQICVAQSGGVRGHITVNSTGDSSIIKEHVMVWLKHDGNNWWITSLDSNFNFYFGYKNLNLKPDTTEIRITTINRYSDTIIKNIIVQENKETLVEISYPPYCEYTKTKNDSVCPICNKPDSVIKLVYHDYFENSYIPKRKKAKNEYYILHRFKSGCDPTWYCRRDKYDF